MAKTLVKLIIFALITTVLSVHSEEVYCPDQKESCVCSQTGVGEVCEFTLRIEQRQTFTSYALSPTNKQLSYDGTGYFLNNNGYQPSTSTGSCHFDNLTTDQDFTSRNCSVPMTVDGVSYRSLITINGRTPGPTLVVSLNQTVVVHVLNYLTRESISVHWHGLFQSNTPWMDGVGFITQPPIDPGATFDYIFNTQQTGTYWYHSHVGSQRTQGLFGGLVIRNPYTARLIPEDSNANVIDDPGQYTLTMIDWHRESSLDIFLQLNSSLSFFPDNPALQVPTNQDSEYSDFQIPDGTGTGPIPFWSGLINGRGRFDNTTATPLSVFSVDSNSNKSNKYYRFRLIGSMGQFAYKFSIDGHTLRVVATDGWDTDPKDVEFIIVHAGERYDFLLNATNTNDQVGYWIRAETLVVNLPNGTEHSARAILTYGNADDLDWRNHYMNVPESRHPCSSDSPCRVLNCPFENFRNGSSMTCISLTNLTAFQPHNVPRFPPNPNCTDCMHFLNFAFEGPSDKSSINARSFQLPPNAYQTHCDQYQDDIDDNTTNTCDKCVDATEGCRCIDVLPYASHVEYDPTANEWESIAMVFSSRDFPHPIHMHGHAYHIVYIGYGTYYDNGTLAVPSKDIDCGEGKRCTNPKWANNTIPEGVLRRVNTDGFVTSTAIRKDVVIVPAGGYVVIAFQANNPGYWFLHCHIEHHQLEGMILLLQEYPPEQHMAPPDGINEHGSFIWTVQEYLFHQSLGVTCEDVRENVTIKLSTPPIEAVCPNPGDASTLVSRAGFGVMLAIIILLATVCVILIVALVVTCCKKNNGFVGLKSPSSTKDSEGFELSTTVTTDT